MLKPENISNREEGAGPSAIQSASISWSQFKTDYIDGLKLFDKSGNRTPLFLLPGNHDISNAQGYYRIMTPLKDPTVMVEIYNLMLKPDVPKTNDTFDYPKDRINYSKDIEGIHLMFINMWPDKAERAWMESDLKTVKATMPVIIFTHANPELDARYFTNPNGNHDQNNNDQFENVATDQFSDNTKAEGPSIKEQQDLVIFFKKHPNISAYFHGHVHLNQIYDWTGPDHIIALHAISVDSPMKGIISSADETKLSFQFVIIDPAARTMTVRECFWNADPENPDSPVAWGSSATLALFPRTGKIKFIYYKILD